MFLQPARSSLVSHGLNTATISGDYQNKLKLIKHKCLLCKIKFLSLKSKI
jgi:hypothetical protein